MNTLYFDVTFVDNFRMWHWPTMSESNKAPHNYTSEASRMLEAALEQMDGIIQGAKYDLPNYFDNFSIQVI